jgi:hypothetical protein
MKNYLACNLLKPISNSESFNVSYTWEVFDPNNIAQFSNGKTINYIFNGYGIYKVIFHPICDGNECEPCIINVYIPNQGHDNSSPSRYRTPLVSIRV